MGSSLVVRGSGAYADGYGTAKDTLSGRAARMADRIAATAESCEIAAGLDAIP
jgi:hypothetical protein